MSKIDRYILDTNVFLQAKFLFYRFDFCQGFWHWLESAHAAGLIYSIKKVKKELQNGDKDDQARIWAEAMPDSFFLDDVNDSDVMNRYKKVIAWSSGNSQYTKAAKDEFASFDIADAFIVATAMNHKFKIVSQEKHSPDSKKKIFLPDAAKAMGVNSIQIFDLLTKYAEPTFLLKA